MGEIANMMTNGTMCQYCGVYIGGAVGYPRSCNSCEPKRPQPPKRPKGKIKVIKRGDVRP